MPGVAVPTEWRTVSFDAIENTLLTAGDIVKGLGGFGDFNVVERRICGIIKRGDPMMWSRGESLTYEPAIVTHPVGDRLRPARFSGRVVSGQAVILPFTVERLQQLTTKSSSSIKKGKLTNDTPAMNVIFLGEYQSSRGRAGHFFQEVSYSLRAEATQKRGRLHEVTNLKTLGFIRRVFGSSATVERSVQIVAELHDASVDDATRLARFALRHTYSGGLPS